MNIKELVSISNEYLPGPGLVRTSRNHILNEILYNESLQIRNKKCHFYQMVFITDLLNNKYINDVKYKIGLLILNHIFPEDLSITILSYNKISKRKYIYHYIDYKNIIYNNKKYFNRAKNKWYITISNLLYLFDPEYHTTILFISSIHKGKMKTNYSEQDYNLEFLTFYDSIDKKYLKTSCENLYNIIKIYIYNLLSL